ncbi:nucleotidyltransferase family protein [Vibrio fluvialis]|nr:nucleotidyltransferase family protein [Vibrio fluvialis]
MNYLLLTDNLLRHDDLRMRCLRVVQSLNMPDCYLGAGFLRNAIWDSLHDKRKMTPLNDVDVVYFDRDDCSLDTEQQWQHRLSHLMPEIHWEVRNQARMHLKQGHAPYVSCGDGIARWVEVQTCVGVRLEADDHLNFFAPFGLEENWSLRVSMNPDFPQPEVFRRRIADKHWLTLWPELRVK